MTTRRAGGVFWAGSALAAGVVSGVRLHALARPPAGVVSGVAAAGAALAAALLLVPLLSPRRSPAAPAPGRGAFGALALSFVCGALLGLRVGERGRAACTGVLGRDSRVRASGVLVEVGRGSEAYGGDPAARADLASVTLRAAGRSCRLPALTVWTDASGLPPPGSAVDVRGRWRPYGGRGLRRPEHLGSVRAERLRPRPGAPAGLRGLAARLRGRAGRRLDRRLPADAAALARALTLADRGGLPAALTRRFAEAGLAHLLAISGLHVGVLAAAATWLFGLRLPTGSRHLAAAALTAAYVCWIGAPPSAVRASLLFAGWALARRRGSPVRTSDLLGGAAAAALLADPANALDAGFQLSFAGFGGVVLGAAAGRRWTASRGAGRRTRGLLLSAAAGAGAFALTAPLVALHFGRAAPVAAVSGLAGTPVVALALLASLATLLLPGWAAAGLAAGAATALLRLLTALVEGFAALPGGHGSAAPPGIAYWTAAALLLAAWVRYVRAGEWAVVPVPAAAAALVVLAAPAVASSWAGARAGSLVCTLDVGQGSAAAVRTRRGHWILLDAGPAPPPGRAGRDAGLAEVVPFLRARGAGPVELLALSHPHLDHAGGAGAVFERHRVLRVAGSGAARPGAVHLRFLEAVRREGARWLTLRPGDRVRVDEVRLLVLDAGGARAGSNDAGVSLRIRVPDAGFTWVNTGDASMEREVAMLRRWPADTLRADLLSVGHHGSRTATSPAWLEAVSPELAVISAGSGNRFGHPHPVTMETLEGAGVRTWRTDRDGDLCVRVRGDGGWRVVE